jgi:20S proteasome subunit alpha 2
LPTLSFAKQKKNDSTMGDQAYSFSLTTFSRTGKLLPIEYALNAVANGRSALGICAVDGVVLATDKKMPSVLVDADQVHKIELINETAGCCFAGVGPDYRVLGKKKVCLLLRPNHRIILFSPRKISPRFLSVHFIYISSTFTRRRRKRPRRRKTRKYPVKRARKGAATYELTYGQVQNVREVCKTTASVMQEYTQRGGVRPFGVSVLVAGLDASGQPALYQVDPSGAYIHWKATAIGKNHVNAKAFLEKRWTADMNIEDAIQKALLTLREGLEGEMTAHNVEVAICKTNGTFTVLTPAQVQDYLDEAN